MGTRNLTMVVQDGEYRVAQYCQWDGYPEGQGRIAAEFVYYLNGSKENLNDFQTKVRKLKTLTADDMNKLWVECGANPNSDMVSLDVSDQFKNTYLHLHRDCGAEILGMIARGEAESVQLNVGFAKDSLFCEWAYVLNLDNNTFEVYKGFNEEPLDPSERFYFNGVCDNSGYFPIKLTKKYKFEEIDKFFEEMLFEEEESKNTKLG